jgi:UDP-N-acetylglucosamine:LPS N-acetylglucosamine transferase
MPVSIWHEVLSSLDWFHVVCKGRYSGEDLYNLMLRRGFYGAINFYAILGEGYMVLNKKRIQKRFGKYLDTFIEKPDLVISVVPFFNGGLVPAAFERDIPFVLLPTDLEIATFLVGFSDGQLYEKKNFSLALAYDDPELKLKALQKVCLRHDQVNVTGFPVRAACLKKYTEEEVLFFKEKFFLQKEEEVVTLVLGAVGGKSLMQYTLEIAKIDMRSRRPLVLNVCCGRNKQAPKKIIRKLISLGAQKLRAFDNSTLMLTESGIRIHIRGFIKDLPELMACSDCIISKTGSCSVNEAIYLEKALLLDDTPESSSRRLKWESANVPFVKKYRLGDAFSTVDELRPKLLSLLDSLQARQSQHFHLPNFRDELVALIGKMTSD